MTDNENIHGQPGEEIRVPDIKYKPGYNKLDSYNWLKDIPSVPNENDIVEIRFKNTRKGFFRNVNSILNYIFIKTFFIHYFQCYIIV